MKCKTAIGYSIIYEENKIGMNCEGEKNADKRKTETKKMDDERSRSNCACNPFPLRKRKVGKGRMAITFVYSIEVISEKTLEIGFPKDSRVKLLFYKSNYDQVNAPN